jgi:hypothetical protein
VDAWHYEPVYAQPSRDPLDLSPPGHAQEDTVMPKVCVSDALMEEAVQIQAAIARGEISGPAATVRSAAADRIVRAWQNQSRWSPEELDRHGAMPKASADVRSRAQMTPEELAAWEAELYKDAPKANLKRVL